jgi:DNA-binding winged helix-turn-helix (wHTH) protein
MEPLRHMSVLQFGTYEVSLQSGEVRKAGLRIRVQQQPMKLLEILLEHPGEVVTREELRSRVWPNESFGDFDQALNIVIGKLRSALEDSAENPRFIETLPKRGYRFIADVSVLDAGARPKRPESSAGDLPGSEEKKTESGHKLQGARVGGWAQTPAVADALGHRRLGARPEFADFLRLAISFADPCALGHPIHSGASARKPFWRRFPELLR